MSTQITSIQFRVPIARLGVVGDAAHVIGAGFRAEGVARGGLPASRLIAIEVESSEGISRASLDLLLAAADPDGVPRAAGPRCNRCGKSILDDSWRIQPDEMSMGHELVHQVCPVTAQPGVLNIGG